MTDHDGHTINVGPGVGGNRHAALWGPKATAQVDRLRAENTALADALDDIAGMRLVPSGLWLADAECPTAMVRSKRCHRYHPDHPDEWCPVCVAEVAWCAWKMGVLGG